MKSRGGLSTLRTHSSNWTGWPMRRLASVRICTCPSCNGSKEPGRKAVPGVPQTPSEPSNNATTSAGAVSTKSRVVISRGVLPSPRERASRLTAASATTRSSESLVRAPLRSSANHVCVVVRVCIAIWALCIPRLFVTLAKLAVMANPKASASAFPDVADRVEARRYAPTAILRAVSSLQAPISLLPTTSARASDE